MVAHLRCVLVSFCLIKEIERSHPKTTVDFSLTGLKQFPQHNRCCHNTNSMALKHKKHTISNHVYAFDLHSYAWHNNPFFFLTNTRGHVIHPEYALCLSFLLY